MSFLLIISIVLSVTYVALIGIYKYGWSRQPEFHIPDNFEPQTKISVLIPARNEEANIEKCIASILSNDYPPHLFEIIVIDDYSTDATVAKIKQINSGQVRCISLSSYLNTDEAIVSYKKKALEMGIKESTGSLIITTDADCITPSQWLKYIAAIYEEENAVMVIGPVRYHNHPHWFQVFQSLDFMSMQGITAATHYLGLGNMSNGANFAFSKEAFLKLKGYEGIQHIASGDDYLLLNKMKKKYPSRISYLKSNHAIVSTAAQPTWKDFLNQRIRWASKMGKYDDVKITVVLMGVYLFNLSIIILLLGSFYNIYFALYAFLLIAIKTIVELIFLKEVAAFFKKKQELWIFPFLQPLHILYIVLAGFLGFVGKYQWKERTVK